MEAAVTKVATAASMGRNQKTVEKLLNNYSFKNPTLLVEALTHSSYLSTGRTYERLEFIGDAALAFAVSDHFYRTDSQIGPGCLTSLRSANVSTEKLARVAVQHNLYPLLLHSSRDLDDMVRDFTLAVKAEEDKAIAGAEGGGVVDSPFYGGRIVPAPKVLADVVEAIIGAVYVDCNFNLEKMWGHVRGILEPIVTDKDHLEQPVSKLYKFCQKNGKVIYAKNCVNGTENVVSIFVDGKLLGIGSSKRKSIAKLNAAREALFNLRMDVVATCNNDSNCVVNTNMSEKEKEGKKLLNEICSRKRLLKPEYRVEPEGPAHERRYKCSVHVQTSSLSLVESGDFKSTVKHAENNAAYKMYLRLALEEGLLWKVEDKRRKTNLLPFLLLLPFLPFLLLLLLRFLPLLLLPFLLLRIFLFVLNFGRKEGK